MSMFDYVRCDWLPRDDADGFNSKQDAPFQTKDFDCNLEVYEITPEGRLMRNTHPWTVDEGKTWIGPTRQDTNFNGTFEFYDSTDWKAQFLDGQLIAIWKSRERWTPNYDEYVRSKKHQLEQAEREEYLATLTPEQQEEWRREQHALMGKAMAEAIAEMSSKQGFMRRFIEASK